MMKKIFSAPFKIASISIFSFLMTQPVLAAKFKCWTNDEGVKECGSYVPPQHSQKRIETRGNSGRIVEVEDRAKTQAELDEIARLTELKKIEDAKIAEQKKSDDILLKTFSTERDINLLRDSKVDVIEGIITVTKSNNKALTKKLKLSQKKAANSERRGKKPKQNLLNDIKAIELRINKNTNSIKAKRDEQRDICNKFGKDLQHFRKLKNITKITKITNPSKASLICEGYKKTKK